MQDISPENLPLRALKIIRKGYKKNRLDAQSRERLQQINELIDAKARRYSIPKKVVLLPPKTAEELKNVR
jgi:hypothetical protein